MKKIFTFITSVFLLFSTISINAFSGQKSKDIDVINEAPSRTFKIPKVLTSGAEVNSKLIISTIANSLTPKVLVGGKIYNFGLSSPNPGIANLSFNSEALSLDYNWKWEQGLNSNVVTASFPIKIEEQGDLFLVTLECPRVLKSEIRDWSLFGIPQWNTEALRKDVASACADVQI